VERGKGKREREGTAAAAVESRKGRGGGEQASPTIFHLAPAFPLEVVPSLPVPL